MWHKSSSNDDDESDGELPMKIKIARAPELWVLGYLEPKVHKLHIGNSIIKVLFCLSVSAPEI